MTLYLRDLVVEIFQIIQKEKSIEYVVQFIEEKHCGQTVYIPKCEQDQNRNRVICEQWDYLAAQSKNQAEILKKLSDRFGICEVRIWQIKHRGG